jgi:hypothetical protein
MTQKYKIMLQIYQELFFIFVFMRVLSSINKCTFRVGNVADIAIPFKIVNICLKLRYSLVGAWERVSF